MTLDEVRTLTIETVRVGMDAAVADLNRIAQAQDGVAVVSDKTSRATKSVENSLEGVRRGLDPAYASLLTYNKGQLALTMGLNSGRLAIDEFNKLSALNKTRLEEATPQTSKLRDALQGVSGQLIALSAGAGPVGVFLSALGPWGLAASVGLGAVSAAFGYVAEESTRMGERAIGLQRFADTTGLTIAQISALRSAGSEFGFAGDEIASSFERLTAQLAPAHRATGVLYDDTLRVSSALATQLQTSRGAAEGINALAVAWKAADDASTRATIAKAAFGKTGASLGPLLGTIADAGGVNALIKATNDLSVATDAQNAKYAQMTARIADLNERAKNIRAGIFTEQGLEGLLRAAELMERTSAATAELARQSEGLTFWQKLAVTLAQGGAEGFDPAAVSADAVAKLSGNNRLQQGLGSNLAADKGAIDSWRQLSDALRGVIAPSDAVVTSLRQDQDAAASVVKADRDRAALLGSAITIDEQRKTKLDELNSAWLDNRLRVNGATEAEAAALKVRIASAINLDSYAQAQQGLASALGAIAPISSAVLNAEIKMAQERQRGITVTDQQAAQLRLNAYAQALGTASIRASIDAANLQIATISMAVGPAKAYTDERNRLNLALQNGQPLSARERADLHNAALAAGEAAGALERVKMATSIGFDRATTFFSPDDLAIVQRLKPLYGDDLPAALASTEASQIRLNNALKQTNDLSGTFASGFVLDLSHGVSAVDALHNALTRLADTLLDMASRQLISGALGGLGSAFGIGSLGKGGMGLPSGSATGGTYHTGGIVGSEAGGMRIISPAYFENAPRFHTGGIAGDEVPLIAKRGEGIFTQQQMAALGGSTNVINAPITVQVQGGGTAADHADQAQVIGDAVEMRLRALMRDEMARQSVPGGLLRR